MIPIITGKAREQAVMDSAEGHMLKAGPDLGGGRNYAAWTGSLQAHVMILCADLEAQAQEIGRLNVRIAALEAELQEGVQ